MGTEAGWGIRSLENDRASAWIEEFAAAPDPERLRDALDPGQAAAGEAGGRLEVSLCHVALAAAEVVAAWCGRPAPELPPQVTAWLLGRTAAVTGEILAKARGTVDGILEGSELRGLWEAAGELPAWTGAMEDLRRRLGDERDV